MRGEEIAKRFGVSLRTIYRDIRSLEEAGVPIISEAGSGYSLSEGYRLPPIMFSKEEAISFVTAERLVNTFTDSDTATHYQSALYKIKAALRTDEKDHLNAMDDYLEVVKEPFQETLKEHPGKLHELLGSIAIKQSLEIDYAAGYQENKSRRRIEPLGIFLRAGHWYLVAFCLLRVDYRTFRVDRIREVKPLAVPFNKTHPPFKSFLSKLMQENRELIKIVVRMDRSILNYLGHQKYYNGYVSEVTGEAHSDLTFLSASHEGFARWIIMFSDHAEVLSPKSLKNRLREIAERIQKNNS